MVSAIERFHCIQDSQLGPNGVLYREVLLYTGASGPGPRGPAAPLGPGPMGSVGASWAMGHEVSTVVNIGDHITPRPIYCTLPSAPQNSEEL